MCDEAADIEPLSLAYVPDHFKTQKMCDKAVEGDPWLLKYVPDHFILQDMCEKAVEKAPWLLKYIPACFVTQEICKGAVKICSWTLEYVPDHLKAQDTCNEAVRGGPWNLRHVPDWLVTQQKIKIWHDDTTYYYNDNEMIELCDGYKNRKAQKALIKEELLPIASHPSRYWDWCMSEDEKKRQINCGHKHGLFFLYLMTIYKNFNPFLSQRTYINMTSWIVTIPDHLKTQEMCNEAVDIEPLSLASVLTILKLRKCVIRQCTTSYVCCYLCQIIFRRRGCATR